MIICGRIGRTVNLIQIFMKKAVIQVMISKMNIKIRLIFFLVRGWASWPRVLIKFHNKIQILHKVEVFRKVSISILPNWWMIKKALVHTNKIHSKRQKLKLRYFIKK